MTKRRMRPNGGRNRSKRSLEWVGGMVSPPFMIENSEERYRPELVLWVEEPSGLVVGHEVVGPENAEGALGRALRLAMEQPLDGLPREPHTIRVADASAAAEVRAEIGDAIPIVVAPIPEIDAVVDAMLEKAAVDQEGFSYLENGSIQPAAIEAFFKAAQVLYIAAPWKVATEDQLVRMDIPALGVNGACISVIGNMGQSFGIIMFPSSAGWEAFVGAMDEARPPRPGDDFGTDWLVLSFENEEDLPTSLLEEVATYDWPLPHADVYPLLCHHDCDGFPRPLTEADLKIATACSVSLFAFFMKHRRAFETDQLEPVSESFFDEHDLEVRFTAPYEAGSLFGLDDEDPTLERTSPLAAVPAPGRSRAKTGRNDPCPCGSGRKYKKCHLPLDEQESLAAACAENAHDLDRRLLDDLTDFASARFGLDWTRFERDFFDASEVLSLAVHWAVYHYRMQGSTILDSYLQERGRSLSQVEREWLESQRATWLSVWEVIDLEPGVSVTFRDLLSDETRCVREVMASQTLVVRDALLARVVDHGNASFLCGVHPRPLPPYDAAEVIRRARGRLRRKRVVPVERLRDEGFGRYLIRRWEEAVEELDVRSALPPDLRNTDGDPILLTTDHFDITPGAEPAVEAALAALENVEPPTSGEDTGIYTFLGPGNPQRGASGSTVIGQCHLTDAALRLETNSRERADALREQIESACGSSIQHRARAHTDPLSDKVVPAKRAAVPELPPAEVQRLLHDFKQEHYANWPDLPLPALDGATPREAAETSEGRAALDVLLKDMENREHRGPGGPTYDFAQLRRDLLE